MRLFLFGPRFAGIRAGISLGREDFAKLGGSRSTGFDPDTGSFLYVIKGDHGRVKIGITSDPSARLAQLQTGSAFPLEFAWIGAPEGQAIGIEYDAHTMLSTYRESGEWFRVTPDAAVGAVCAAAQRRNMKVLGVNLEQAETIRRIGMAQDAAASGNRPWKRWEKWAVALTAVLAVVVIGLIILGYYVSPPPID